MFCRGALSLTVVTEATAAGEQSTSVTSLCTVCHGNRVHKGQRSKVKLCEVVIEPKTTTAIMFTFVANTLRGTHI